MGKFVKENRECAARGYIRALMRYDEPVIILDEHVVEIVSKELGSKVSIDRIERKYIKDFDLKYKNPPPYISVLMLNDDPVSWIQPHSCLGGCIPESLKA